MKRIVKIMWMGALHFSVAWIDFGDLIGLSHLKGPWMVGAMISFTLMAVAGRSLASELDTFEIMMYRSFIEYC